MVPVSSVEQKAETTESPSKCYTYNSGDRLDEVDMASVPDGVCATYTYAGIVIPVPSSKSQCETWKGFPATYGDVTCCTEDLCNK
eukprot:CAMPEP_0171178088 /NCGR_PEP_ID=MMETSP0790-20130122/12573_1 /TAXON_ID=2925 /ORGANISM="Alexandrium catenella, Strain OF101" /LENGTH=84 /DNA_ID=CAMNT_0011643003 /DNA_START=22 /DNA_END=273 /DNA_ORIENTATION=+